MTPPPLTGSAYAVSVGEEVGRANYFNAGLVFSGAYTDNIYVPGTSGKVGDEQYSFQPTLVLNRRSARASEILSYEPGFTMYQQTSQLNGMSQQGEAKYQFHQNSNLYNQPNPFAPTGVSSTGQAVNVYPFENQLSNSSNAGIDCQYARNAMIGGSASFDLLRYQDHSLSSAALQNQNVTGASAFFSRRLSAAHYTGLTYQFSKIITFPERSYTNAYSIMGFFTVYLTRNFSLSILGGPQHYDTRGPSIVASRAWSPEIQASVGWNGRRAGMAGSYSRGVSTTSGLVGAYRIDAFQGGALWHLGRTWTLDCGGAYSEFSLLTKDSGGLTTGIRTATGSASIVHPVTDRLSGALAYAHFHQDQALVGTPFFSPESNRVTLSISYQLSRSIGR
jgi:hypothetical protein